MPELAHDTAEDAFHEIQLSGKQLVFLFMTGTVVLVAVFLCGVLVGRNARSSRDAEPVDATTVAAPSTPATADAGPPAAEPPAPPAEEALSYPKRLQGATPPEEPKPKPQATPPPAQPPATAPPARDTSPVDVPTTGKPGTWFVQVVASQNRSAAAEVVKSLVRKGYPAYLEMPARGATVMYRVRVGRYTDRRDAEQAAKRLKEDKFTADVRR